MMARHWTQRVTLCVFSLLALTACPPPYELPPLTTAHPAHSEATAAPELSPSQTLAYGPADVPSPHPAAAMAPHTGTAEPGGIDTAGQQTFVGEGKVVAVVPEAQQIVIDHGDINGFMDAMTMGFKADSPALLEGIQAGDRIRFTIGAAHKAIINIEKLNQ